MPKTLFNSTEKSNFILNMKDETVKKIVTVSLLGACVIIPLMSVFAELISGFFMAPNLSVILLGVASMIVVVVALVKNYYDKSLLIPFALLAFMLVMGTISLLNSYSYDVAFYGMDGRNEGLLTIIFYVFMFFMGVLVKQKNSAVKFFDFFIAMGIVQCLWAFVQIMPFGPDYAFRDLDTILLKNVFLPSGLAGSPVTFAMLMSMLLPAALMGAVFDESKKRRILYCAAGLIFAFFGIKTSTLAGLVGIVFAIILTIVMIAVKISRKNKNNKISLKLSGLKIILVVAVAACAVVINIYAPKIYNTSGLFNDEQFDTGLHFYDGAVVWQDSFYRLASSGYYRAKTAEFDIMNPVSLYSYLWGHAVDFIKQYPITGSGEDCFVYTTMTQSEYIEQNTNSFDRPYNDYLYIAASRGILSLLAYLAFVAYVLVKCIKRIKTCPNDGSIWVLPALAAAALAYLAVSFIGISVITVAPFFWIIMGLALGLN